MTLSKRSKSRSKHSKECNVGSLPSCYCAEQRDIDGSASTPKPSRKNFGGILGSLTTLRSSRKTAAIEHQRNYMQNGSTDPGIPMQGLYSQNYAAGVSTAALASSNLAFGVDIRSNPYDPSHHYATLTTVKQKMKSKPPIANRQRSTTVSQSSLGGNTNGGYASLLSAAPGYSVGSSRLGGSQNYLALADTNRNRLKSADSLASEFNCSRVSVNVETNRLKLPAKMMIVRGYTARSEDEISVSAGDGVIVLDCSKNENYLVYKPSSDELPAQEGWVPKKCLDMMYVNRNDSYVSLHHPNPAGGSSSHYNNPHLSSHSISSFCSMGNGGNNPLSVMPLLPPTPTHHDYVISTLNRRNYQKPRPPPLPLARHLSVTSSHNHNHSNLIGHLNDPIRGGIGIGGGDSSSLSSSFAQLQMSPGPSPEVEKKPQWNTLTRSRDPSLGGHYGHMDRNYPGPPGKAEVRLKTKASVIVSWKQPNFRGAHPITRYTVEIFNKDTGEFDFAGEANIRKTELEVTKLRPGATCIFRIISHNSMGLFSIGPESDPYTIPMNTPGARKKKLSPKEDKKWSLVSTLSTSINDLVNQTQPVLSSPISSKSPPASFIQPSSPGQSSLKFIDHFDIFYNIEAEIARGRFSKVRSVQHKTSRNYFTAKFIPKHLLSRNAAEMECQVMQLLQRCPYTCKLLQAFENDTNYILVMPTYSNYQLIPYIINSVGDKYTEAVVCNFMQQLIAGLLFIHGAGIIHLDLKPENIIISQETRLVICDFGESVSIYDGYYVAPVYGNFEFKPPEILCKKVVSCASDVWCLGCVGYVLLSGLSPFLDQDDSHQTALNIVTADVTFSKEHFSNISFEAQDFIQNLLRAPSNKRLPLELCKNHTWVQSRGDYNSHLDPGNPLSRLDTERLQNFVTRRKNVEGDVKLLPEDLETLCIETWTNAIG